MIHRMLITTCVFMLSSGIALAGPALTLTDLNMRAGAERTARS
jgi:uncharacterized protein YraI